MCMNIDSVLDDIMSVESLSLLGSDFSERVEERGPHIAHFMILATLQIYTTRLRWNSSHS